MMDRYHNTTYLKIYFLIDEPFLYLDKEYPYEHSRLSKKKSR